MSVTRDERGGAPILEGARVIVVLGPLELGGSERQALLFARYLVQEQRAAVEVWGTMGGPGRAAALCEEYGITWRVVAQPWVAGALERRARLLSFALRLRRARPDVILPYTALPNIVCGLVWRRTGARLCVWNQRDDGIARVGTRYEPLATARTPLFIANSEGGAEHLVRDLRVERERVRVVHNGVELTAQESSRAEWRARLGISEDSFVTTMVANFTVYKDHATLLKAWAKVIERTRVEGRDVALLLAGRFDETHDAARESARELGLGESVRFLGQVTDVAGLLAASDAGVLCSNSEGSPNAVLEYMAAALPVAATDIPAMREVLDAENHALLAAPLDAEVLASKILELAGDAELRARLGARNRRRVEEEFSPRRMCEATLGVIAEGLGRDGGRIR
ncbi:MAG TPA: glycosyltransferase [Pyrinomonadaceae bacterium]|nr:glycosyltransferase [Pyrinomonadaceae bacterium]